MGTLCSVQCTRQRGTRFFAHMLVPLPSLCPPALSSEVSCKPSHPSLITNSSHFNPTNTKFSPTAQFHSVPACRNRPPPITLSLSLPISLYCLQPTFARRTSGRNLEAHDRNLYNSFKKPMYFTVFLSSTSCSSFFFFLCFSSLLF